MPVVLSGRRRRGGRYYWLVGSSNLQRTSAPSDIWIFFFALQMPRKMGIPIRECPFFMVGFGHPVLSLPVHQIRG